MDVFEIIYRTSQTDGSPGTTAPDSSGGITQTQADARYARQSLNLSDLDSAPDARSNIGLGLTAPFSTNAGNLLIADASGSARGVVSTASQTFAGAKTFSNNISFGGSITSLSFTDTDGVYAGSDLSQAGVFRVAEIRANELRVKAFVAEISAALYGEDILTKSRGVLSRDFVIPAVSASATLYVEDLEGLPNTGVFEDNDFVRMRIVDRSGGGLVVADVWGNVDQYNIAGDEQSGEQSWRFTRIAGGSAAVGDVVYTGSVAIDYGQSGDSVIVRSVIGTNTPRDTQLTWVTSPIDPANFTIVTRVGNLGGIANTTGTGFYGENVFLTGGVLIGDLSKVGSYISYANDDLEIYVKTFTLEADDFTIDKDGLEFFMPESTDPLNEATRLTWVGDPLEPTQVASIGAIVDTNRSELVFTAKRWRFPNLAGNSFLNLMQDGQIFSYTGLSFTLSNTVEVVFNSGDVFLNGLPETDPNVKGKVWNHGGQLRVSSG